MIIWTTVALISLFFNFTFPVSAQEKEKEQTVMNPAITESIEKLGGSIRRIAQNENDVEIDFHLGRNRDGLRQFGTGDDQPDTPPSFDGELKILKKLNNIVSLHLGGTDVTDDGLTHVASLNSLQRLHLEKTSITNLGLAHLKELKNLSYLNLYGTKISDKGLKYLEGLKNLKQLYLWQSKVTSDGVRILQKSLPNISIELGWGPTSASASKSETSATKQTK